MRHTLAATQPKHERPRLRVPRQLTGRPTQLSAGIRLHVHHSPPRRSWGAHWPHVVAVLCPTNTRYDRRRRAEPAAHAVHLETGTAHQRERERERERERPQLNDHLVLVMKAFAAGEPVVIRPLANMAVVAVVW